MTDHPASAAILKTLDMRAPDVRIENHSSAQLDVTVTVEHEANKITIAIHDRKIVSEEALNG